VLVNWMVSDEGSGVASQQLQLWNGATPVETYTTLPTCAFAPALGGAGVLRAVAADQVGNQASAEKTIDMQASKFVTHLPVVLRQVEDQPQYPDLVVTNAEVQGSTCR
jgi:hypothetical protein